MMECFILPNGTGKSRLSAVVIFSITTIDILHNHDSRDIPVPTALGHKLYAWGSIFFIDICTSCGRISTQEYSTNKQC